MVAIRDRVVDGRAIEHYKDFNVRESGLAVPREPKYKQAISNGYAPNDFIVDNSLVLYLPLWALKGSTFKSVDRYGHLCTVTGALWKPNGREFDGDDYIDCSTGAGTALGDGCAAVTVELWFKTDDVTSSAGIFNLGDFSNSEGEVALIIFSNSLIFNMSNVAFSQSFAFTDTASWHHLVAEYTGSLGKLYLDNVEKISHAHSTDLDLNGLKTIIAAYYSTSYALDGRVGEVRIYNRVLSVAEITHNYNVTKFRYT